jgi:hypothetical protein
MRVKLCMRCPYPPRDISGHYDSKAVLHLCVKCDADKWRAPTITHARPTGGKNARPFSVSM